MDQRQKRSSSHTRRKNGKDVRKRRRRKGEKRFLQSRIQSAVRLKVSEQVVLVLNTSRNWRLNQQVGIIEKLMDYFTHPRPYIPYTPILVSSTFRSPTSQLPVPSFACQLNVSCLTQGQPPDKWARWRSWHFKTPGKNWKLKRLQPLCL